MTKALQKESSYRTTDCYVMNLPSIWLLKFSKISKILRSQLVECDGYLSKCESRNRSNQIIKTKKLKRAGESGNDAPIIFRLFQTATSNTDVREKIKLPWIPKSYSVLSYSLGYFCHNLLHKWVISKIRIGYWFGIPICQSNCCSAETIPNCHWLHFWQLHNS
jgi:hypothetical protein